MPHGHGHSQQPAPWEPVGLEESQGTTAVAAAGSPTGYSLSGAATSLNLPDTGKQPGISLELMSTAEGPGG